MKNPIIPRVGIVVVLFAIAAIQVSMFLSWKDGQTPWLSLGTVGLDAVLAALLWWTLAQGRTQSGRQNRETFLAAVALWENTRAQASRWLSWVTEVDELSTEDRQAARDDLAALSRLIRPLDASPSVTSTVDVLQSVLLMDDLIGSRLVTLSPLLEQTKEKASDELKRGLLNHFRLRESVSFLTGMTQESSRYSEKVVLEVLATFREVTEFSRTIGVKGAAKVQYLMDASNPEGLAAIQKESVQIRQAVSELVQDLSALNDHADKATQDNLGRMERVQVMAGAIGDFSESIRMISLNLNIEAARASQQAGGNRRSFQVLATKLSEFALRAGELARQQEEAIADALQVVSETGRVQRERARGLVARVSPISGRLEPFARIVNLTFDEFRLVESSLSQLSGAIDEKLRSVLGQFQFQDLVRQEQEHILALFAHIRDLADEPTAPPLDASVKRAAWEDLLLKFERLATTENERIHIDASRKGVPGGAGEPEATQLAAGSVSLF